MNSPEWLKALSSASEAFEAVEGLCGTSGDLGNSAVLEVRNDLSFTIRRLTNLSLLHGVSPAEVEKARQP